MENRAGGTAPATPARRAGSAVVELRQYTHVPGRRDALIALFEREFIAEQEALGMEVIDHFRDLDDPDRFVWLRGFPDIAARARATAAFYERAVWARHREAANATLLDTDNVLLLRPASRTYRYPTGGERPPVGATELPSCLVVATIWPLDPAAEDGFPALFERAVAPALEEAGAAILAAYATEHCPNNYPRLPIREGERVFAWFARFPGLAAYEEHLATLARSPRWTGAAAAALAGRLVGTHEVRRLAPTARSRTRG